MANKTKFQVQNALEEVMETPSTEDIVILDAEALKRRGPRAKTKEMKTAAAYTIEADARCQA